MPKQQPEKLKLFSESRQLKKSKNEVYNYSNRIFYDCVLQRPNLKSNLFRKG